MTILHIIAVLLTLGSSPDCEGFGICILENRTEERRTECLKYENCIEAEMEYADGEVLLYVSQRKISDKAFLKYFTKEHFLLEKDYSIPEEVSTNIGLPSHTVLPSGKYLINEEGGKIVVRIKV